MAVSCGFSMLLVLTIVALFTFSQLLFQQRTSPETVEKQTQTDLEIAAVPPRRHYPLTSKLNLTPSGESVLKPIRTKVTWSWDHILPKGTSNPRLRLTPKLFDRRPTAASLPRRSVISRRSVLASFQSDRMVPTGPNPLHNSNRSQVILP